LLEVFRIGWEVEKIASELLTDEPSSSAFAHNGDHLAVGFKSGQVSLLTTDKLDEVYSPLHESSSAVTALTWKQLESSLTEEKDPMEVHFKPILQVDPKPSDSFKHLNALCMAPKQSVLVVADSAGTITYLYGGIFPVAKIDLARAFQSYSDLSVTKLEVNSDCSETIVMGHEARGKFVTRLDSSVLSGLVFKSPSVLPFFKVVPQLEYTLAYLDKQVATCKREWTKFHGKLNANLRVLADKITERQARYR
jgi:hypothetical protein